MFPETDMLGIFPKTEAKPKMGMMELWKNHQIKENKILVENTTSKYMLTIIYGYLLDAYAKSCNFKSIYS